MKKHKNGLSPVIATVMLIAIVVMLALIVFVWFRGVTKEVVVKFGEENIELTCDRVKFEADYNAGNAGNGKILISNNGDVAIAGFKIQKIRVGEKETVDLGTSVKKGAAISVDFDAAGFDSLILLPVLRGRSNSGEIDFVCDNNGIEVDV